MIQTGYKCLCHISDASVNDCVYVLPKFYVKEYDKLFFLFFKMHMSLNNLLLYMFHIFADLYVSDVQLNDYTGPLYSLTYTCSDNTSHH